MTILDFNSARRQDETARDGVDLNDIRDRLHADVRGFIEWMYGGRAFCNKTEARIGNVDGEAGESLAINLRTGEWFDHATGEGGDLISLYMAWRAYGDAHFLVAIKEIASDYLGDAVEVVRPEGQPPPQEKIQAQKDKLGSKPKAEHGEPLGAPSASWIYVDCVGNVVSKVNRYDQEDGTKTYRPFCFRKNDRGELKWSMGSPDVRPLYNIPGILAATDAIVLVEGEKCAEALIGAGIVATTAMQGAKAPIEKTDWQPLAGKRVIIWPDNDKPGSEYGRAAAAVLRDLNCTVLGPDIPAGKFEGWDAADCIAAGEDPRAVLATAKPLFTEQAKPRMHFYTLAEMREMKPPTFLIQDMITANGLSMIWGASGSMKTFVGLDLALSVGTGMAWHGKPVKTGPVLYVAAEGSYGLCKRAIGWVDTRGKGYSEPKFFMLPVPIQMTVKADTDAVLAQIQAMPAPPVMIIIDTVARTFGGNENTQEDMGAYVAALDRLRMVTGAHVMVIHHSGVGDTSRERGSNVLRGAADSVFKVERKKGGEKIDIINKSPAGKQKDFEEAATVKLRAVEVAFMNGDEELKTIVLNEREDDEAAEDDVEIDDGGGSGGKRATPRGANQAKLYEVLKQANGMAMDKEELCARSGVDKRSFENAIGALLRDGLVDRTRDITTNAFVWRMAGT